VDARCAPQWVFLAHHSDELAKGLNLKEAHMSNVLAKVAAFLFVLSFPVGAAAPYWLAFAGLQEQLKTV
jgi:hypothetical protein